MATKPIRVEIDLLFGGAIASVDSVITERKEIILALDRLKQRSGEAPYRIQGALKDFRYSEVGPFIARGQVDDALDNAKLALDIVLGTYRANDRYYSLYLMTKWDAEKFFKAYPFSPEEKIWLEEFANEMHILPEKPPIRRTFE